MGIKVRVKKKNSDKVIVVDTEPKETPKAKKIVVKKKETTTATKSNNDVNSNDSWTPSWLKGVKIVEAGKSTGWRKRQQAWQDEVANYTAGLPNDFFKDLILRKDVLYKILDDIKILKLYIQSLRIEMGNAKNDETFSYVRKQWSNAKRELTKEYFVWTAAKKDFDSLGASVIDKIYYRNILDDIGMEQTFHEIKKLNNTSKRTRSLEYKYLLKLKDLASLHRHGSIGKSLEKYAIKKSFENKIKNEDDVALSLSKGDKRKAKPFLDMLHAVPQSKRHNTTGSFENEYNRAKDYAQRYAETKAKQLLASITKNSKGLAVKPIPKPTKTYAKSTLKKISTSQGVVPQSVMDIRGIADIFNPSILIKVARRVRLEEGKIPKTIPASFKTRFTEESDKNFLDQIKGRVALGNLYFCVIAATFFQILVSNTPIDDFYKYKTKELRKGKRLKLIDKSPDAEGGSSKVVRFNEELEDDINERMKVVEVEKTHRPDDISVRADWVLHFKGKSFKAYKSTAAKGSRKPRVGAYFSKEDFMVKTDTNSINKLALILYEATKDSKNENNNFTYENVNPRWEMLEYGGYKNNSAAKTGSRYGFQHGVSSHYTYQAPSGFVRLTEAYYNQLITSGRGRGFVSSFLQTNSKQLNVTDVKKIPELIKVLSKTYDRESMVGIKQ